MPEAAMVTGKYLSEVQTRLSREQGGPGGFLRWVDKDVELSRAAVYNRILLYKEYIINSEYTYLSMPVTALIRLARPSTSVDAREEVLKQAKAGQAFSIKRLEDVVGQYTIKGNEQTSQAGPRPSQCPAEQPALVPGSISQSTATSLRSTGEPFALIQAQSRVDVDKIDQSNKPYDSGLETKIAKASPAPTGRARMSTLTEIDFNNDLEPFGEYLLRQTVKTISASV
jgi:hypothetical protein